MSSETDKNLIEKIRGKKRIIGLIAVSMIGISIIFQSLQNSARGNDYIFSTQGLQRSSLSLNYYKGEGDYYEGGGTYDGDSLGNSKDSQKPEKRCVVIGKDARGIFDAWAKIGYPKGEIGEIVIVYERGRIKLFIANNDGDRYGQPDIIRRVKRELGGPKKGDVMCSLKK